MRNLRIGRLIVSVLICEAAGLLGSLATFSSLSSWYAFLNKPSFNPSPEIFGPVWTILYLLIGISFYLVWVRKGKLVYFWIQLVLNTLWSYLFFGLHSPALALLDIVALLVAIILTIKSFYKAYPPAGLILLPYLAWVVFATVLNFSIWRLN